MFNSKGCESIIVSSIRREDSIRTPEGVCADAILTLIQLVQSPETIEVKAARLDAGFPKVFDHLEFITDRSPPMGVNPDEKFYVALPARAEDILRGDFVFLEADDVVSESSFKSPVKLSLRAERNFMVSEQGNVAHCPSTTFLNSVLKYSR